VSSGWARELTDLLGARLLGVGHFGVGAGRALALRRNGAVTTRRNTAGNEATATGSGSQSENLAAQFHEIMLSHRANLGEGHRDRLGMGRVVVGRSVEKSTGQFTREGLRVVAGINLAHEGFLATVEKEILLDLAKTFHAGSTEGDLFVGLDRLKDLKTGSGLTNVEAIRNIL